MSQNFGYCPFALLPIPPIVPHLILHLLGPFEGARNDEPLQGFESNKVRALLAYLAVGRTRSHPRGQLAALLWPERPERAALSNLRHALANLRRVLGEAQSADPFLLVDRYTLQLHPQAQVQIDVADFYAHLTAATRGEDAIVHRKAAVALYRGEFLQGLYVRGCISWEEWLRMQREALAQAFSNALRDLTWDMEHQRDYAEALIYARQWLQQAPWNEEAHRQTIRLLALDGQRSAALAQFDRCRQVLASELGIEPSPETISLVQAIRARQYPAPDTMIFRQTNAPISSRTAPFVARQEELGRLDGWLKLALAGRTQMAFITGIAGSGKSALAAAFGRRALQVHRDLVIVRGECSAFANQGDPFLPFRDILLALIGQEEAAYWGRDMGDAYLHHLQAIIPTAITLLGQHGSGIVSALNLGPRLMLQAGAFLPEGQGKRAWLHQLNERSGSSQEPRPEFQRQGFDEYVLILRQLARRRPLVLIVDDMQWADSGSLALLFHLSRRLYTARILFLGIFRSEDVLPDQASPHPLATLVREWQRRQGDILIDLDQASGRAFVDAYLDMEPNRLDAGFRQALLRRTSGHPLFTVELLRELQASGDLFQDDEGRWAVRPGLAWAQIPARVEAVIAERLAALKPAHRELLTVASIVGDVFTADILAAVLPWTPEQVLARLAELAASRYQLVQFLGRSWSGQQPLSHYRFRHSLFQEYLYQHAPAAQRAVWHGAIARALLSLYQGQTESIASALARHFEAAGQPMDAANYYLQAGQWAMRLAAPEQAMALLTRGLAQASLAPPSPARSKLEMALQMAINAPLLAIQGWGAAQREEAIHRAYELSRQSGDDLLLIQALFLQADLLRARGELASALALSEHLLSLAQRVQDAASLALAHLSLGETCFFMGDLASARTHLEQAIGLYQAAEVAPLTPLTAVDLAVVCHVWLAWVTQIQGDRDAGAEHLRLALDQARMLKHPLSLAFAFTLGAYGFYWLEDNPEQAAAFAGELAPLMAEKSLAALHPWGLVFQGWVAVSAGDVQAGIAMMEEGMAMWRSMGAVSGTTCQGLPLARAYIQAGRMDAAQRLTGEMAALIEKTGERVFEEAWRALADRMQ